MTNPVLWHFPISHYNEKVRWALDYKAIPHRRRALFLEYLPMAMWKTGQPSLPILIQNGDAIADSTRIIEYLEHRQPRPPLYPADRLMRQKALELEDFLDEELGPNLRTVLVGPLLAHNPKLAVAALGLGQKPRTLLLARAVFPFMRAIYRSRHKITPKTVEAGHQKIVAALNRIEAQLQPSGYLIGDSFSVADLTAAALLAPLVLPPEFQYPLPPDLITYAQKYTQSLGDRRIFQWACDMYRLHRGKSAEVFA